LDSDVEIDDLKTEMLLADEEVVGFDIPMGDTVFVEICEALNEAPADLVDVAETSPKSAGAIVARKSMRSDQDVVLGRIAHVPDCIWNESSDEIMCSDLGLKVIKNFEDLRLVRIL
jgi:hypothetical protein